MMMMMMMRRRRRRSREPKFEVRKPKSGIAAFKPKKNFCNAEFSQVLDPRAGSSELTMRTDSRLGIHNWGKSWELKNKERSHSRGP